MRFQEFTRLAHVLVAVAMVGLGTACEPAEEGAPELGLDDTSDGPDYGIEAERGIPRRDGLYLNRSFAADLRADRVIPPVAEEDLEGRAHGRGFVRLQYAVDERSAVVVARPRIQFTICGLDDVRGIEVTGASLYEGGPDVMSRGASLESIFDARHPQRLVVDSGCVNGYFSAQPGAGMELLERVQRIVDAPERFYLQVSTVRHPRGVARGQLRVL
jgi:hypothetical protein